MSNQSARLLCGYLYASAGHGESTQDMVFAGHDLIAENGTLLAETAPLRAALPRPRSTASAWSRACP